MSKDKLRKVAAIVCGLSFLLASCASTTMIHSNPEGAAVYVDNVRQGVTPLKYSDTAVLGTTKSVRLEKEKFRPLNSVIRKDTFKVAPCIGGVLVLFPFLWVLGYPDEYGFNLEPLDSVVPAGAPSTPPSGPQPVEMLVPES